MMDPRDDGKVSRLYMDGLGPNGKVDNEAACYAPEFKKKYIKYKDTT